MTEETLWTLNVPLEHISDGITALLRSSTKNPWVPIPRGSESHDSARSRSSWNSDLTREQIGRFRRAQKRSGIPIAPSETESAAGRDDAKRPPPSPMRWDCRGCRERFPRKDPGVLDLLGSSLSCDTTGLTLPVEYLCLRFAERLKRQQQRPKQVP